MSIYFHAVQGPFVIRKGDEFFAYNSFETFGTHAETRYTEQRDSDAFLEREWERKDYGYSIVDLVMQDIEKSLNLDSLQGGRWPCDYTDDEINALFRENSNG
jgi:hypothetical protein